MTTRFLRALPAILLAVLTARAVAAEPSTVEPPLPGVLRLDEALRLLRERGLDLLIAEEAVASAEGEVHVAGAIANPALSLSYGRSFTYGHCTDAQGIAAACGLLPEAQYGAGVSDQGTIFDAISGKRGLRLRSARAALAAARASRDDALRALTGQTKEAFLRVLLAQEARKLALDVAASSARTAELTRARHEAGSISEADAARVDVAKLESDQAADSAAQALEEAKVALGFLLGVRELVPGYRVDAPELLQARAPQLLAGASADVLLERARARRPDLAAARLQLERAQAALALARRQRVPDVALSLNYAQQGTTASAVTPPTLTAGVAFPIPVFHQQQGEIRKAEADRHAQELQARKVEAQVTSDVGTAFAQYEAAARLTRRMEGGLLDRARRARDLVSIQYQKGSATLLDFLDAQRTFIGTNAEYLQDLWLFWSAAFRLEQAVGEELR
jgi:outer membrane protein, heavy metal efflux system